MILFNPFQTLLLQITLHVISGFLESVFEPSTVNYLKDPWTSTLVDDSKLSSAYVDYADGETKLRGYYAYDKTVEGKRPIVLVVPDWNGINEYEIWRAKLLGMMGYVGRLMQSICAALTHFVGFDRHH